MTTPEQRGLFGQGDFRCRLEWGRRGARDAAARGDGLVLVDTLSFSTAVATALSRGASVHPCSWEDDPQARAAALQALCAVRRTEVPARGPYSLSPLSLEQLGAGDRIVIKSINGATCLQLAAEVPVLFVAALVNASAVARAAGRWLAKPGRALTVVACGERWEDAAEDGPLRVALEDYLGAGAVMAALDEESKSPEARACQAAFRELRAELPAILKECGSGRELQELGFAEDVSFAAELDRFDVVPVLSDGWLVDHQAVD
jgi:2-phosphosulfolactate phosphatase